MYDALDLRELELKNFMPHRSLKIKFPARGAFVITGSTGSGKSSGMVEPIGYAAWWRLIRSSTESPCREGSAAFGVYLRTRTHTITHQRQGKKIDFTWHRKGEEPKDYGSPSKAQEALEKEIGDFSTWYWTHVFWSVDLDYFVNSTDTKRKELLEELLGWGEDVFAQPLKRAKTFLKEADTALSRLDLDIAGVESRIKTLEEADGERPVKPPKRAPTADEIKEARRELKEIEGEVREAVSGRDQEIGGLEQRLRQLRGWMEKLGGGKCPLCTQEVEPSLLDKTKRQIGSTEERLGEARRPLDLEEQRAQVNNLTQTLDMWVDLQQQWRRYDEEVERQGQRLGRLEEARDRLADLKRQRAEQAGVVETAADSVAVLGPRGARAQALGGVLSDINDRANDYLAILSLRLQVELGLKDDGSIYLKVMKGGGGKHKLVSQGENQQIALGVRLAIASLRNDRGTLFLDEAMKSISVDNLDRMVEFVQAISHDRCVVVITHDQQLARALVKKGADHFHFD